MKKVLLIYKNEGLSQVFEKELKNAGYQVTPLIIHPIQWNKFTFIEKTTNIFRRFFFKDTQYIHTLYNKVFDRYCNSRMKNILSQNIQFDYCFTIHGGMIDKKVLSAARKISKRMIDYQPDGIQANNRILQYREFYDDIYAFDPNDLNKYPNHNFSLTTNFYIEKNNIAKESLCYDMFYIGALADNRKTILEKLNSYFPKLNNKFILGISTWQKELNDDKIEYIHKHIPYEENVDIVLQSKILVDIKRSSHDGLSFRFFEAIGYDKKIITNNQSVKYYDFYNSSNIFITDFENLDGLTEFINTPFIPYSAKYKEKYLFKNWVKRMFKDYEK